MNAHRFIGATLALVLTLLLGWTPALAHKSSDAYLRWQVDGTQLQQRLDIALIDLDRELELDADGDGRLSWGEVRRRWPDIEALAGEGVRLRRGDAPCRVIERQSALLDTHTDGAYAVLRTRLDCSGDGDSHAGLPVTVDYRLFERGDATHRALARVVAAGGFEGQTDGPDAADSAGARAGLRLLVPGAGPQTVPGLPSGHGNDTAAPAGVATGLAGFVVEGMHHIAIGTDHVLFLVSLLLVAVWRREGAHWTPREHAASAWRETLRLVTAFTLAHSLTLGLAATGVLAPPSRWIETLIAASVLVAALDNLRPFVPGPRWTMVSVFGLVHGFGFAGPLQEAGLAQGALALPLLGFNLGVELGQLAIVAIALPLAVALRATGAYRRALVPGASVGIALLALVWLVERGFEVRLPMPF